MNHPPLPTVDRSSVVFQSRSGSPFKLKEIRYHSNGRSSQRDMSGDELSPQRDASPKAEDRVVIELDGGRKQVVRLKQPEATQVVTLGGMLGKSNSKEFVCDSSSWAGENSMCSGIRDFRKKKNPTTEWQKAYFKGGVL